MSIRLTGQLLSPTDGSPAANGQIRFISLQGTGKVPKGAIAIEAADSNGDYDFTLEFGRFSVEIRQADKFVKQGAVSVNADTPTPLEIGGLLEYTEPLTPGQIIYVEQLTAQAEAAAQAANVSQSAANSSAMAASNSAAEAKSEADRASEITGLDTVEEAIDLTLSKTLGLMTETEAMAQADAYEQVFAASGMVHMGEHDSNSSRPSINEGMFIRPDVANVVGMGRGHSYGHAGTSKTPFPLTYIAGALISVYGIDATVPSDVDSNYFQFPQAEAGTRVYDSTGDVRGSGKATLDFRFDQDPKYGNVPTGTDAQILREGVGRAFEGQVKNGDIRLGDNGDWSGSNGATYTIADGVITGTRGSSAGELKPAVVGVAGKVVNVEVYVTAMSDSSASYYFGYNDGAWKNEKLKLGLNKFTVTMASNFASLKLGDSPEDTMSVSYVSIKPVTEEVVTHRVDQATWESYDEELTGRTEVFECIQSLSTTFGDTDVPTVLSTRPNSYFDQYDGQSDDPDAQNTKYRCVVWDDLTDEQKRKVAAYMGNKLYKGENGYLVNRRLRARTFRGAGNGDWRNIDSVNNAFYLSYASGSNVSPQGMRDVAPPNDGSYPVYTPLGRSDAALNYKGAFSAAASGSNPDASSAYKGRCFMYVVASVPRVNQGAYHPNLNPWGCNTFWASNGGTEGNWYHNNLAGLVNTKADCFAYTQTPELGKVTGGAYQNGNIASAKSGHPDGIFYDGITAGGLNGVIDWRLPAVANDSPEEQAKVQAKVENKTYRGLEKLVWTELQSTPAITAASNGVKIFLNFGSNNAITIPAKNIGGGNEHHDVTGWYIDSSGNVFDIEEVHPNGQFIYLAKRYGASFSGAGGDASGTGFVALFDELNLSVSGEFNTSMVIGDPANILQTDALKDGWLGTWCPVIPDGTSKDWPLTRKSLDSSTNRLRTDDNGTSWTVSATTIDNTKNSIPTEIKPATRVVVIPYTAYAKVTKPSSNKPVYNGKKGLMSVFTTMWNGSATLVESLIGKVSKNNSGTSYQSSALIDVSLDIYDGAGNQGKLISDDRYYPLHAPLSRLTAPTNNSPAVKVLPYQIAENEQCFIGYQANELTWDASYSDNVHVFDTSSTGIVGNTGQIYVCSGGSLAGVCFTSGYNGSIDLRNAYLSNGRIVAGITGVPITYLTVQPSPSGWGDDDKIKVTADGSDTFVDLNGNTNLSVSHKTTMPTGWTKNRARIGEQVEGVDL